MAQVVKTILPWKFYKAFLKEDVRPDGRELFNGRKAGINIKVVTTANGSAVVKIGETTVVCAIKAELAKPKEEEPDKGYIVPNVELPALCSNRFRHGPPGDEAQAASQFMADILKSSALVPPEELCIEKGKLCWTLYFDMVCVNHDGALIDTCMLGVMSCLLHTKLPKVTYDETTEQPVVDLTEQRSLEIRTHPVSCSFCLFKGPKLVFDPTADEESLALSSFTVVINEHGQMCGFHKGGVIALSEEQEKRCIDRAVERQKEIQTLLYDVTFGSDMEQ